MENLAELRKKVVEAGAVWVVERIYATGRGEPLVEGFDQEKVALERMGQLIEEAAEKRFAENELKSMVREGGFYSPIVKVKMETAENYRQLYDVGP